MLKRITHPLLWFVLIAFAANGLASTMNHRAFTHDLEHGTRLDLMLSQDHLTAHHHDDGNDSDGDPLSESEHALFHAFGHIPPFPVSAFGLSFAAISASVQPWFVIHRVLPGASKPLFRPPRSALF